MGAPRRAARPVDAADRPRGAALRVKPILEMCNGEFRFLGVARSTHGALQRLEEELRSRLPVETVAAAYTRGCEVATDLVA